MTDEGVDKGRKTEDMVLGGLYLFQGSVDKLVGKFGISYLNRLEPLTPYLW
jgi:hypothetical protein